MQNYKADSTPIYINGKKVAALRNGGNLCDIRRHSSGFLYSPTHRVAIAESLLERLGDRVVLQFTDLDSGNVWTCTVIDFRRWAEPIQFAGYEPQRAVELSRMNATRSGKPRKNELTHVGNPDPVPAPRPRVAQLDLFSR